MHRFYTCFSMFANLMWHRAPNRAKSRWHFSHVLCVQAPSNNHRIVLNFTFMDTECTYDYLFVYDGDSYQNPLVASLSGNTVPQPMEAKSGKVSGRHIVFDRL